MASGSTHSTCSVTWAGWLALEYAPKPLEGLAGSRSCQVTVVRVASSPGGALPFGRSREGAVWAAERPR